MATRAYWKGSLKLSLVSCPVLLYPASTASDTTRFQQIVPRDEIGKRYLSRPYYIAPRRQGRHRHLRGDPRRQREKFLRRGLDRGIENPSDLPVRATNGVLPPFGVVPANAGTHAPRPRVFARWLTASHPTNDGGFGSPRSRERRILGRVCVCYLFAVRFFAAFFFEAFFGTFAPAALASDRPIAIACLRLFTLRPDRPLFSVPALRFFIARSTLAADFFEYFRAEYFRAMTLLPLAEK
jgi:hypothetical protein